MPGIWPDIERLTHMKYQIVMTLILLANRPCSDGVPPSFAVICQYSSFTVQDLALSIVSPRSREILGLRHLYEKSNLWKQVLR